MKILILGGTMFIGRAIAQQALQRGYETTLFHRGKSGPGLFPEAHHIHGDRFTDLHLLKGREWDVMVDTNAYFPRAVRLANEVLSGQVGRCLQISTISVYDRSQARISEDSPINTNVDPEIEEVTWETYGPLKALCELEAQKAFDNLTLVRPTYVVGPNDPTDRFTYWVDQLLQNNSIKLPARSDGSGGPFQYIYAPDLGRFCVDLIEDKVKGTFNACNHPQDFREVLTQLKESLNSTSEIIWEPGATSEAFAPLMPPTDGTDDAFMNVSNERAVSNKLNFTSLNEVALATADWWQVQNRPIRIPGKIGSS